MVKTSVCIKDYASKIGEVWIGAKNFEQEGTWKWVTGEKFEYSAWNEGEPNNDSSIEHYCVMLDSSYGYTWNDAYMSNSNVSGFICELENAATYNIYYNSNGGNTAPAHQTKKHGEAIKLSTTKATRDGGYTFKGWSTTSTGNVEYLPGDEYTKNEQVTLYAVWEENRGQDIVVLPDEMNLPIEEKQYLLLDPNATYKWTDGVKDIPVISMKTDPDGQSGRFAIDGWNIKGKGVVLDYYNYVTVYMYVDDPEGITEGLKPNFRFLKLSSGEKYIDSDKTIAPNAWQRIPIDISSIECEPLEMLKQYHFRPLGKDSMVEDFEGVTVYVEKLVFSGENPGYWVDKEYEITYDANGGTGAPSAQTKTHEQTIKLSSTKPQKDGCLFKGWSTSSTGNVEYVPGASYTANSDVTLYAVWEKDKPSVGDTNGDNEIGGDDLYIILEAVAGMNDSSVTVENADFDNDGKVTLKDINQFMILIRSKLK